MCGLLRVTARLWVTRRVHVCVLLMTSVNVWRLVPLIVSLGCLVSRETALLSVRNSLWTFD